MAANKNIKCTVVWERGQDARHSHSPTRPSDLLPWADPYIASLVKKLQREARQEALATQRRAPEGGPLSPWDLWDMCYDDADGAATHWDREPAGEPSCAPV